MDRFLETFFNPVVMAKYTPDIIAGIWVTLQIASAVIVAGILAGLALACLRSYGVKTLNFFIICYADIFRALPPLVVILILYFGFP
jgi:polar amino acid transport system permease protein